MNKIQITILYHGPALSIEFDKFHALSEYFSGDIIIPTSIPELLKLKRIGSFNILGIKYIWGNEKYNHLKLSLFCIKYALRCRFNQNRPSIISTYDPLKTGFLGLIMSKLTGACFVPEVNGVYNSVVHNLESNFMNKLKALFYPKLQNFILNFSDGIKLLFQSQIDDIKLSPKPRVIKSFPCYVDIYNFLNRTDIAEQKEILFAGFPFWVKGVDILILAFKNISDSFPSWKLKILGWYPDQNLLNKYIDNHPNIIIHKSVFPHEMPQHICSCSIFVLPSRTEAMGRVLVEAMAAGKARIGSNVDGIPTVINDGIDGLLFKKEDPDDLAKKLSLLMINDNLRKQLSDECKKRVLKEFSKEQFASNMYNFFSDVLNRKS